MVRGWDGVGVRIAKGDARVGEFDGEALLDLLSLESKSRVNLRKVLCPMMVEFACSRWCMLDVFSHWRTLNGTVVQMD